MASIEPAKELTRTKEPEFMFLHTKDFWFRSIWIDLHQALTIDRESSRDRAPIGLVRCICKDDHVKGKHAHVKFKLSNIHAFVPVWMAPMMLKNFRLIAAQSSPVSPLGQLDYREGWFAIIPKNKCFVWTDSVMFSTAVTGFRVVKEFQAKKSGFCRRRCFDRQTSWTNLATKSDTTKSQKKIDTHFSKLQTEEKMQTKT